MTMRLRVPIWLSPPAMIRQLTRIEQIVANVGQEVFDPFGEPQIGQLFAKVIVTPGDSVIAVDGNVVTLLANKGHTTLPDGSLPSWQNLLNLYGTFREGVSALRLMLTDDINGPFVSGTLQLGDSVNTLIWMSPICRRNTLPRPGSCETTPATGRSFSSPLRMKGWRPGTWKRRGRTMRRGS